MAREGTKRQVAIEVIQAMANDPADEVVQAIMVANDLAYSAARAYFTHLTKEGFVEHTGAPLTSKRVAKPKVKKEKAPRVAKAKKEKKSAPEVGAEPTGEFAEKAADFLAWRQKKQDQEAAAEAGEAPVAEDVGDAFGDEFQGVPEWMPDSIRGAVAQGALAD